MKQERIDDVLDRCLARIVAGEDVNACLHDQPEHAATLAPLLRLAVALRLWASLQQAAEHIDVLPLRVGEERNITATVRSVNPVIVIRHRLVRALARIRGAWRRQGLL